MPKTINIGKKTIILDDSYSPLTDKGEEYMSDEHLAFFYDVLIKQREEIIKGLQEDHFLQDVDKNLDCSDEIDKAIYEDEVATRIRNQSRQKNLLKKIDHAISNIENGNYGYCESTGDEIGLKRLLARPFAALCVQAQEAKDRLQKEKERVLNNEASAVYLDEEEN